MKLLIVYILAYILAYIFSYEARQQVCNLQGTYQIMGIMKKLRIPSEKRL